MKGRCCYAVRAFKALKIEQACPHSSERVSLSWNKKHDRNDSSGGAGIQADLKAMTAYGVYGMSVLTAITSQNTKSVDAVQVVDTQMVEKQFRAVIDDIGCDVIKTGMLGNESIVESLAALFEEYGLSRIVVDPVMVSTSGARLLEEGAIKAFIRDLLPKAYILTPNLQEARLLLAESQGISVDELPELRDIQDISQMAKELKLLGPKHVLVKGGHLPLTAEMKVCKGNDAKAYVVDVLCKDEAIVAIKSQWSPSRNTHGTGCTLASAIACELALGKDIEVSVRSAIDYVHGAIVHSFDLGSGNGPLNHMYRISSLPFSPGNFIDYMIGHPSVKSAWISYIEHDFVARLGDGTLPLCSFKHFLKQDYLYLVQYARLNGLAAYKAETLDTIVGSARIVLHIHEELQMHIKFCESWGISQAELDTGRESVACTVYTKYIESIGNTRDWMSLQVALAACLIGYGEVAKRLFESKTTNQDSPYYTWIKNYCNEDYTTAVSTGRALVEKYALLQSPTQIVELVEIFRRVTEYEALFWTSALEAN